MKLALAALLVSASLATIHASEGGWHHAAKRQNSGDGSSNGLSQFINPNFAAASGPIAHAGEEDNSNLDVTSADEQSNNSNNSNNDDSQARPSESHGPNSPRPTSDQPAEATSGNDESHATDDRSNNAVSDSTDDTGSGSNDDGSNGGSNDGSGDEPSGDSGEGSTEEEKPTGEACSNDGEKRCAGSGYQECSDGFWIDQTCNKNNVCKEDKKGGIMCVDPDQATVERESCSVDKQKRCSASDPAKYQVCDGEYWSEFKCDKGKCVESDGDITCGDPNQSSVHRDPCTVKDEQRCLASDDGKYQICDGKFWNDFKCDKGKCVESDGDITCGDPNQSSVHRDPCTVKDEQRCSALDDGKYQICDGKFWNDFKCDKGKCFKTDDGIACGEENTGSNSMPTESYSLISPPAYEADSNQLCISKYVAAGAFAAVVVFGV